MSVAPIRHNARADFYHRIGALDMAPLWEVLHALVPVEPSVTAVPKHWVYSDVRPFIDESGGLITAKEAERRVLVLENPAYRGQSRITSTLYAGLQLILPGEVAPAHRHTQSALRLVMEGDGAYTAVDGERTIMREGDFIITPNWTWHDHGNESNGPMVWLDGLDVPLVAFLDAGFRENHQAEEQPIHRPMGDSLARFGSGLVPLEHRHVSRTSPVFNYPYLRTREALHTMARHDAWDPHHGLALRFANPVDGDWAMPTIGTWVQHLPKGFATAPYRSTDGTVFCVLEGEGESRVGDQTFSWTKRDVFVAPGWFERTHKATSDAVLFCFSDRPVQEKLDLWREKKGPA